MEEGFTEVSYSLCHGDMGNLELFLLMTDYLQDEELKEFSVQMANYIVTQVRRDNHHWRCGIPGRQQIPGLMLGLAGIGYQLLRLYNRDLPSVLMMEGPKGKGIRDMAQTYAMETASAQQRDDYYGAVIPYGATSCLNGLYSVCAGRDNAKSLSNCK